MARQNCAWPGRMLTRQQCPTSLREAANRCWRVSHDAVGCCATRFVWQRCESFARSVVAAARRFCKFGQGGAFFGHDFGRSTADEILVGELFFLGRNLAVSC